MNVHLSAWMVLAIGLLTATGAATQTRVAVPASDWRSDGLNDDCQFDFEGGFLATNTTCCAAAPVYLTENQTVTEMTAFLWDEAVENFGIFLYRKDFTTTDSAQLMAGFITDTQTAGGSIYTDASIAFPEVDLNQYAYYLSTCLFGDTNEQRIYSVEISTTRTPR